MNPLRRRWGALVGVALANDREPLGPRRDSLLRARRTDKEMLNPRGMGRLLKDPMTVDHVTHNDNGQSGVAKTARKEPRFGTSKSGRRGGVVATAVLAATVLATLGISLTVPLRVAAATRALSQTVVLNTGNVGTFGQLMVNGSDWASSYSSLGDLSVRSNGPTYSIIPGHPDTYGWPEWQCTELVVRFANVVAGAGQGWAGSAKYFWANHPSAFMQVPNGSSAPQFGDIAVFTDNGTGHVAIVAGAPFRGTVKTVSQNGGDAGWGSLSMNGNVVISDSYGLKFVGLLRDSVITGPGSQVQNALRPATVELSDGPHIYFRGTDGLLHQTHWTNGAWATDSPSNTAIAGSPQAIVDPVSGLLIYSRGSDGLLHQTHWANGAWVTDSPSSTPMGSDPAVVEYGGSPYIYFRGTDGLLHQTHWTNGAWATDSPSNTAIAGSPQAVVDPVSGLLIYSRGSDGLLHQTHWANGAWVTDSPSTTPMGGDPTAVEDGGVPHIFFRGSDGLLHQTHWTNGAWATDTPSSTPMA
jgi:CHAP domain